MVGQRTYRTFRASQRGGPVKLKSCDAFTKALKAAEGRIDSVIGSKLSSFFELAEYNWMPPRPPSANGEPSTYVFEMITFLTAYVDSVLLGLDESLKTRAYRNALARINVWLIVSRMAQVDHTSSYKYSQNTLCGREVAQFNEAALSNVMADVTFVETEIRRLGRPELDNVFDEVKQTMNIILSDAVSGYMEPSIRSMSYAAVKPARLSVMLLKLSRGLAMGKTPIMQGRADKRRREADEVGRLK